jgi:hypothetical protein
MIVFDPAIFRLPVLRRRRCATKLQQQPEVAIHDGRRGSQRGWVGGALDTRGSNRLRVANERTAVRGKNGFRERVVVARTPNRYGQRRRRLVFSLVVHDKELEMDSYNGNTRDKTGKTVNEYARRRRLRSIKGTAGEVPGSNIGGARRGGNNEK